MPSELTDKRIRSLKPKANSYYAVDSRNRRGTGRLVLKVQKSGRKTFLFRYMKGGKTRFIPLGEYPALSLAGANKSVAIYSNMLIEGVDPKVQLEKKRLEQEVILQLEKQKRAIEALKGTAHDLFIAYTDNMKNDGKRSYRLVLQALEKEAVPFFGSKKASDVTANDIKIVLSKMIQRGACVQSNRVRSYLSAAFNYGIRHDNDPAFMGRPAIFGILNNPVLAIPRQNVEKVGNRDLSSEEIRQLWGDLSKGGFSKEVEILIKICFTMGGQRPNELVSTEWKEIDLMKRVWEFPANKTKNRRVHIVPINDLSAELLKSIYQLTGHTKFVFPKRTNSNEVMVNSAISKAINRYCSKEYFPNSSIKNSFKYNPFVPRDIRRTVKTRMGEIGISKEIRDRIANHALNDVSSKHYDRYDYLKEKKEALSVWGNWIGDLVHSSI